MLGGGGSDIFIREAGPFPAALSAMRSSSFLHDKMKGASFLRVSTPPSALSLSLPSPSYLKPPSFSSILMRVVENLALLIHVNHIMAEERKEVVC